ncbi:MAG: tRNA (adenosine(37)-N6)-dimethylallyltransferase MiaA [Emcibacter sp.]|nr:tRNA (adenosine(37)-N6)-dimethylallyltransferase MiaA [Emcibacter sp.]
MKKKIILLAGPTASGKSATALEWAKIRGGEIINADSMQVYAELSHLTARPSAEEESLCPHHLYGVLKGDDLCSAERWRDMALVVIEDVWSRGGIPIMVGGTGLYFKTLLDGLSPIPEIEGHIRQSIRATITSETASEAHQKLAELDPLMAEKLAPNDTQRISRALEVILSTGKPFSYWQSIPRVGGMGARDDVDIERYVIELDRAILYERCDLRFRHMVDEGNAIEEVRSLMQLEYSSSLPVMKSLGVPQIIRHLQGDCSWEEMIYLSQTATRQFAKRQMTWFRNQCGDWNNHLLKY